MTPARTKPRRKTYLVVAVLALAAVVAMPTAAAAGWNLGLGTLDVSTPIGWFIVALLGLAAASFMGAKFVSKNKTLRKVPAFGFLIAAVLLLGMTPGGFFKAGEAAAPASSVGPASSFFSHTDVSIIVREEFDNDGVASASVLFYEPGATDKQLFELSVTPKYSCTTAATFDCKVTAMDATSYDMVVTKAGYYSKIVRGVDVRQERTALSSASVGAMTLPTVTVKPHGAFGTDELATTYDVNSDALTYTVFFRNTDTDGWILHPAYKIGGETNIEFTSVSSGQECDAVQVSGTTYIVYTGGDRVLGPSKTATCVVTFQTSSTTSDFELTADDLFQQYGANAFVTNANIKNIAAASAVAVADAS